MAEADGDATAVQVSEEAAASEPIFCFNTPKILRLLDRRLGFINMVVRWMIWAYILAYVLIGNEKYMSKAQGYGPLAVKLVNDTYAYANAKGAKESKLSFTAFDSTDATTPYLEPGALFIMTEVAKTQGQTENAATGKWEPEPTASSVKLTLEGVEKFKVRYMAFISFPSIDPAGASTFQTEGFGANMSLGGNTYTVEALLKMGGTSVDKIKSKGTILQVNVLWNCFLLLGECKPTLAVTPVDGGKGFSVWRTRRYGKKRDVEKCTGIRMIWKSVGVGKQLDIVSVIFNLAVGVALLPIADFITDFTMLWVLPERKHYIRRICQESPDFYEMDEIKETREENERLIKESRPAVDVEALLAEEEDD